MPQTTPSTMRVVPSGQIYRQLFDAQFQLSQSLSHLESESRVHQRQAAKNSQVTSLPIIRLSQDEMEHGILTSRQKSWVAGLPNDPYTENPVLYKQYSDFLNQKLQETNFSQAEREVINLPDVVATAKTESDVIDRVKQSKSHRHEALLDEMYKALTFISMKMERVIEELSAVFQNKLARSDGEIESILDFLKNDEDLKTYQLSDLYALWEKIKEHSVMRTQWISSMHTDLQSLEISRYNQTREVFTSYGKKLAQIAFLMPPDLQRFLDKESQRINQAVLSNHRSYADLCMRLTSADIEREKTQHSTWLKRMEDWRILNTRVSVEDFKEFMKSDAVINPVGAKTVKAKLLSDLEMINNQRVELIRTLCDMQPPNSTRTAVQKWQKDLQKLSEEIDNVIHMHLSKLHEEYELVCKKCLEKVDNIKTAMLDAGICSSHTASQVVDEFMLPLVGKQQRVFEHNLDSLLKMTEEHVEKVQEEITTLYKFAKGAASLWDVHENNLAWQEKELNDQVATIKKVYDQSRQEYEAQLDRDLDTMRQDANEIALKENLVKALTLLEKIKELYEMAHEQQIKLVQNYPSEVMEQVTNYDHMVCSYFGVSRVVANDVMSELHEDEMVETLEDEAEETEVKASTTEVIEIYYEAPVTKTPSFKTERIFTRKGTEFYIGAVEATRKSFYKVLQEDKEEEDEGEITEEHTFLTEVKEEETGSECQPESFAEFVEVMDIPETLFSEVQDRIRMNFLEHLDDWSQEALVRANTLVVTKSEELNGELDLKLHLHQPRPRRIELDIHNVRAAELVLHAERITRHCSGIDKSLNDLRTKFKAMSLEHSKMAHTFEEYIDSLEEIFVKATKSARLVKLQNQVEMEVDKFMSSIRASLRQFRQHMEETLLKLRGSNAKFIKSFRVFSDGGNFCPEEIEIFRKKLDRMSLMIDSTEGLIMSELESAESKFLDSSTKTASNFEDRFKSHMSDLIFMECIGHGLTNVQVKIKAEVAKSNAQAQKIEEMSKELQEKLSACTKRSLDKEPVTDSQLNDSVLEICTAVFQRSRYLYSKSALKVIPEETPTAVRDDDKSNRASVGSSAGIIKSIFKAQTKAKEVEFSMDPGVDALASELEKVPPQLPESNKAATNRKASQLTGPEAAKEAALRKTSSGKALRIDKKISWSRETLENLNDGDKGGNHFLQIIWNTVKESLDGLVATAEVYYNQKGSQQITRPQAIPQTRDQCADILLSKLQSYYSQAEVYFNQCLKDFQEQLSQLEQLCASIPAVIIANLARNETIQAKEVQNKLTEGFHAKLSYLNDTQKYLENELRPTLGHPQRASDLTELCVREKKWLNDYTELVTQHIQERQERALENAKVFLERLVETSEQQLQIFDNMLVVDDIDEGRAKLKSRSTYELIRQMHSEKLSEKKTESSKQEDLLQAHKTMWTGLPSNQFYIGEKPSSLEITASVQTCKSTLAHSATVEARDKAFDDYKKYFEGNLQEIEAMKEKLLSSQQNWDKSWESSVKRIISLYEKED